METIHLSESLGEEEERERSHSGASSSSGDSRVLEEKQEKHKRNSLYHVLSFVAPEKPRCCPLPHSLC